MKTQEKYLVQVTLKKISACIETVQWKYWFVTSNCDMKSKTYS